MAGCCCDPGAPRPRMLLVDGDEVGVVGLDEVFKEVSQLVLPTEEKLADELLSRFKTRNYVPAPAEKKYAKALLAEYKKYYS